MKMYSVNDAKAEFYHLPFYARTDAEAVRLFAQMVNSNEPNNHLAQSPSDFTLYSVGEFDEQSGEIISNKRKSLTNGKDCKSND